MKEKQPSFDLFPSVNPTGSPWAADNSDHATVPVPLPVILVKIDGPYTERDRKLWVFLLHAAWDELEKNLVHEISVRDIANVFRDLGGEHDTGWVWESAKRLGRTIVEWEHTFGDGRYEAGITSIFAANISKEKRQQGRLYYNFPPLLIPIIKQPGRFSRLRTHFMIGLSGKHAVTLYQILEGFVNQRKPELVVPLDEFRRWMHLREGAYEDYKDLKKRVLRPAITEINKQPGASGFTVAFKPIRQGQGYGAIRFVMTKSGERSELEDRLANGGSTPGERPLLKAETYQKARQTAPGWDVYHLESEWVGWWRDKGAPALKSPDAAFLGFCRRRYEREGAP